MPVFRSSFTVGASVEAVRAFHQGDVAKIFKALAPPGTPVTFQRTMEVMTEGAILEFTMYLGGCVPIRWTASHSGVCSTGFVDTMTEGPVQSWVHTHRFIPVAGASESTVVEDVIEYEYGGGMKGCVARLLFNPMGLRVLFLWRAFATRRMLAKEKGLTEKLLPK